MWQLCGEHVRNACSAGFKGNLQDGAHPSRDFLSSLNPAFADFAETKICHRIGQLAQRAGGLTAQAAGEQDAHKFSLEGLMQAAAWTGLPEGIAVAVGVCHHPSRPTKCGANSSSFRQHRRARHSACSAGDAARSNAGDYGHFYLPCYQQQQPHPHPGLLRCGARRRRQRTLGYEAGQSGVGDVFAWYVENQVPSRYFAAAAAAGVSIHQHLSQLAAAERVGAHGLVALDWLSGNRSILVDHELSGQAAD